MAALGFGTMSVMALRKLRRHACYVMPHGMGIDCVGSGIHLAWIEYLAGRTAQKKTLITVFKFMSICNPVLVRLPTKKKRVM